MNNTNSLVLFIIGAIFIGFGVFLAFIKWRFDTLFLIVGMTFVGFAMLVNLIMMFRKNKKDSDTQ